MVVKKRKTLFNHLKAITEIQSPNYWDEITEEDKKTFSVYMINRFLSMNRNWTDLVNYMQKYTIGMMYPKHIYKLYSNVFPKGKVFLKYVKGRKTMEHPKWVLEIVAKYYEVSLLEAQDYLETLYWTDGGRLEVRELLLKYGSDLKEVDKLNLI